MARVTVEDCLRHINNRFDLVMLATKRARQLNHGVEPLVPWNKDKATVVALREIAEGKIGPDAINQVVIEKPQPERPPQVDLRMRDADELEEDINIQ